MRALTKLAKGIAFFMRRASWGSSFSAVATSMFVSSDCPLC